MGLFVSQKSPTFSIPIYYRFLKEIADLGATDLSIPVRWVQEEQGSNTLQSSAEITVSDEVLISVIKEAHRLGLRVFIMPFIHLKKRPGGVWRGVIEPDKRVLWWTEYHRFILHYAKIAKENRVELFSVGSELLSMENDTEEWGNLIRKVREELPQTKLTYSANWDRFEAFGLWKELDYVGISAYPPLSKEARPSKKMMSAGWAPFKNRLNQLRRRFPKKKILFTEVGYVARQGAASKPWDHNLLGKPDVSLQKDLYEVWFETWFNKTYVEGLYVWNWFGEEKGYGFSPRKKPAEEILRFYFSIN